MNSQNNAVIVSEEQKRTILTNAKKQYPETHRAEALKLSGPKAQSRCANAVCCLVGKVVNADWAWLFMA